MKYQKRKQLFIDPSIQGALVVRTVLYWAFCISMVMMFLVCWRIITGPSRDLYIHLDYLWFHYGPVFIASILLLPILIIDTLKMSNRFVGPMIRLRAAMRRLADGEPNVMPIQFRNKDFWKDFADEFNRLLSRLDNERKSNGKPSPQNTSDDSRDGTKIPIANVACDNETDGELAAFSMH